MVLSVDSVLHRVGQVISDHMFLFFGNPPSLPFVHAVLTMLPGSRFVTGLCFPGKVPKDQSLTLKRPISFPFVESCDLSQMTAAENPASILYKGNEVANGERKAVLSR